MTKRVCGRILKIYYYISSELYRAEGEYQSLEKREKSSVQSRRLLIKTTKWQIEHNGLRHRTLGVFW